MGAIDSVCSLPIFGNPNSQLFSHHDAKFDYSAINIHNVGVFTVLRKICIYAKMDAVNTVIVIFAIA